MDDQFSDNRTPGEWSESETDEEERSSSSETEKDKEPLSAFINKIRMASKQPSKSFSIRKKPVKPMANSVQITENPIQNMENPTQIAERPVPIMEDPVQITDSSVQIIENPTQILESPVQIMKNPVQIVRPVQMMENAVQIMDNETQTMENPVEIMESPIHIMVTPVQIMENPAQIIENPVHIIDNQTQFMENSNQIIESPVQIMVSPVHIMENSVQIMENATQLMEGPVQIMVSPVQIMDPRTQMMENAVQIEENPTQIIETPIQIIDNPTQIFESPVRISENPDQNIEFVQDPIESPEPSTAVTKKRKIPDADQETLAHYMLCQKFRLPNWSSVRYSGVQDQFEASPGFCALKPNDLLPEIIPDSKYNDLLKRFDLTCGAIVNGLLQNTTIFRETVNTLPRGMKNKVSKAFHGQESKYRKNSDGLLQYTCGRRQEIMQDRRKLYKPPNKVHKKALYEIPPSETHLFEDDAFTNLVAQMKGIDKIFPTEKKRRIVYCKHGVNQNKEHGNRRNMRQATSHQDKTSHPE